MKDQLRRLPSVDSLLQHERVRHVEARYSRPVVVQAARQVLSEARDRLAAGGACPNLDALAYEVQARAEAATRLSLHLVINATGVIIHTNLGRAPLSTATIEAMAEASSYSNLEFDLVTGERGSRFTHLEKLLCEVTGAEAGIAVNNNAAAVLLCLTALAYGKEVIVSRGQAVEIGGGFRIPDVLRQSGARLVEVGTTNRTYIDDYREAISPDTAFLLRVHTSNFRVVGFTHEVEMAEMVSLGQEAGIPVLDDLGSGSLLDTSAFGLAHEPTPQESIGAGAGLVCFSGDKLLGGPQAGIIVGKREMVQQVQRHPLARALRLDKATIAGLSATLLHYKRGEAMQKVPVWQMIATPASQLAERAAAWVGSLLRGATPPKTKLDVVEARSTVGGGSLPEETLPTYCLAVVHPHPNELAARLRTPPLGLTPVVARVEHSALLLDPRTVLPEQDEALLATLRRALEE